jgi:hypothetical protein
MQLAGGEFDWHSSCLAPQAAMLVEEWRAHLDDCIELSDALVWLEVRVRQGTPEGLGRVDEERYRNNMAVTIRDAAIDGLCALDTDAVRLLQAIEGLMPTAPAQVIAPQAQSTPPSTPPLAHNTQLAAHLSRPSSPPSTPRTPQSAPPTTHIHSAPPSAHIMQPPRSPRSPTRAHRRTFTSGSDSSRRDSQHRRSFGQAFGRIAIAPLKY